MIVSSQHVDGHLGAGEDAFLDSTFAGDLNRARVLMLIAAGYAGVLVLRQLTPTGLELFSDFVRGSNLFVLVMTLIAVLRLNRCRQPVQLDRLVSIWLLTFALAMATVLLIGPPRLVHPAAVVLTVALQIALPISFTARATGAALVCIAAIVNASMAMQLRPDLYPLMVAEVVVQLAAFAVGFWYSALQHRDRRRLHAAGLAATEAGHKAAELGRLLPVCAWCNQVRRDDEFWVDARAYIESRGIARVDAALCDECRIGVHGRAADAVVGDVAPVATAADPAEVPAGSAPTARAIEPDDDAGYRAHHAAVERNGLACFFGVVLVYSLINLMLILLRMSALGVASAEFLPRITLTIVVCVALAASLLARATWQRDLLGFAGGLLMSLSALFFLSKGVTGSPATAVVLLTLMVHLLLPIPLQARALVGFALFAAVVVESRVFEDAVGGQFTVNLYIALAFSNLVGLWAAARTARARRQAYDTTRARLLELERGEVLEGLMPMCSGCGNVRDGSGYWDDVFSYLARNTGYRASHGICPDCLAAQRAVASTAENAQEPRRAAG